MKNENLIREDLKDKNLNRVLPQVRKQIKIQKERVRVYLVVTILSIACMIVGLSTKYLPTSITVISGIIIPFSTFSFLADRHILKCQKRKEEIIIEIQENS